MGDPHIARKGVHCHMKAMRAAVEKEPRFHAALKSLITKKEMGTRYVVSPVVAMTMGKFGLSLSASSRPRRWTREVNRREAFISVSQRRTPA